MHAELWYVLVDDSVPAGDLAPAEALLSPAERERSRRFYFDTDRRQFVVAHALVRTMLSHIAGVESGAWEFRFTHYGKPEIAAPAEFAHLRFNLSHTRGLAACIVVPHVEVGVDAESLAARVNGADLAARVLSPSEVRALGRLPARARPGAFLDYWTLKEAYVKARGAGLSLPLDTFSFDLPPGGPPRIAFELSAEDDPCDWQFQQFRPSDQHWMAVALCRGAAPDLPISCRRMTPQDLWGTPAGSIDSATPDPSTR